MPDVPALAADALSFLEEFIEAAYDELDDADMRNIAQVTSMLNAFSTGRRAIGGQETKP